MSNLARRYAEATLRALPPESGPADFAQLEQDFARLVLLAQQNESLHELVHNPSLLETAPATLVAIAKRLEIRPEAARLLALLLTNGRAAIMGEVRDALTAASDVRSNRQRAWVKSAVPLTEAQLQRLEKALAQQVGQAVQLEVETDPSLMGGLVCRLGNLTFDMSLERQLAMAAEDLGSQTSTRPGPVSPQKES